MNEDIELRLREIEMKMVQLELDYPDTFQDLPEYQQSEAEVSNLENILHDAKLQKGE